MNEPTERANQKTAYGLSQVDETNRQWTAPVFDYLPHAPENYRPKIAIIGAGGISAHHLSAYRKMGLPVTLICDLDVQRAEQRRAEFYPQAAVSNDVSSVWQDKDIEIVDIATHPEDRPSLIAAALRAQKHVLSQKPFVVDLEQGRSLVDLADACDRKLAVNQNGRWAPHYRYLLEAVHSGLVGPVSSIDFSVQWDHTWTKNTPFDEIYHLILYDFAIHWFDMTASLLGDKEAETVHASVRRTSYQQCKPPFLANVSIAYPNAQVTMSFNAHVTLGQEDRTVIVGRDGTLRSFGPSLNDQQVQVWTKDGTAMPALEGDWFTNGFEGTMAELLHAIVDDRQPSHAARDNLRSLKLCFAAVASADGGRPVRVGDVQCLPSSPPEA